MKKYVITLICCVAGMGCMAQDNDASKNISTIKRDTTYLYAEATMKDQAEAMEGAKAILEMTVGDWVREQYPKENIELCIAKAKEHCMQIQTRRGDFQRAFVYVKKTDIMPVANQQQVMVFQVGPKPESAEQPERKPLMIDPEELESGNTANSQAEQPAPQQPVVQQPKAEEPAEEPMIQLTADEEKMINVVSFYDIEPYVKGLKSSGRQVKYGKYATMPANEDCHMFIYDREGGVRAILRKTGSKVVNLESGGEDEIKNYKNCGAIWIQLK